MFKLNDVDAACGKLKSEAKYRKKAFKNKSITQKIYIENKYQVSCKTKIRYNIFTQNLCIDGLIKYKGIEIYPTTNPNKRKCTNVHALNYLFKQRKNSKEYSTNNILHKNMTSIVSMERGKKISSSVKIGYNTKTETITFVHYIKFNRQYIGLNRLTLTHNQ